MVEGNVLLNRDEFGVGHDAMFLDFSAPILGFGTWVFDNNVGSAESFTLTHNMMTSSVIDNGGGIEHTVDGFLGVTDPLGITRVRIDKIGLGAFFELDHMQIAVAPVPIPAALPLFAGGLGLLGLLGWRRKRKAAKTA